MTPTGASPDVERERVARIVVQHFTSGPWWQPDGTYAGHCDNGVSFAGDDLKAAQFDYGYKLADAILSALSSDRRVEEWQAIGEVEPDGREWLGWAPGCGYEVVRIHSDGYVYAGAFSADWIKFVRPLPAPPAIRFLPVGGEG